MALGILARYLTVATLLACLGHPLRGEEGPAVTASQAGIGYQPVSALALSPDGRWVAAGGENGGVIVWELETGKRLLMGDHGESVQTLAFSPDGRFLASGSRDKTVRIWALGPDAKPAILRTGWEVEALAWSPDSKYLATGGWGEQVPVWDASERQISRTLGVGGGGTWAVLWSLDGRTIATGSRNGKIRLWDTQSWKDRSAGRHKSALLGLDWSRDGRRMVSGDLGGELRLQELPSERILGTWKYQPLAREFALRPDGKILASVEGAGADTRLHFHEVAQGTELGAPIRIGESVQGLAWAPEGAWLLAGCLDGNIRQVNPEGILPRTWAPLPKWRWDLQAVARGPVEPKGYVGRSLAPSEMEFCTLDLVVENLARTPQVIRMEFLRSTVLRDGAESYYLQDCIWKAREPLVTAFIAMRDPKLRFSSQIRSEDGSYSAQAWQTPQGVLAWVLTLQPGRRVPVQLVFIVPKGVPNPRLVLPAKDTLPRIELGPGKADP